MFNAGWWFGTCCIVPIIPNDSYFLRVETTNQNATNIWMMLDGDRVFNFLKMIAKTDAFLLREDVDC